MSKHINEITPKPVIDKIADDKEERVTPTQQNYTTIVIKNINKNLTSEEIYVLLRDHFFPKERTFNAIYTERKKDKYKNFGICFINFIQPNHAQYFWEKFVNTNYLSNKKGKCQIFWSELQGDEFIKEMSERTKQDKSLNFIRFSNGNSYY